jgi:hypothetical protein
MNENTADRLVSFLDALSNYVASQEPCNGTDRLLTEINALKSQINNDTSPGDGQ